MCCFPTCRQRASMSASRVFLLRSTQHPPPPTIWNLWIRTSDSNFDEPSCNVMMFHGLAIYFLTAPGFPRRFPRFQFMMEGLDSSSGCVNRVYISGTRVVKPSLSKLLERSPSAWKMCGNALFGVDLQRGSVHIQYLAGIDAVIFMDVCDRPDEEMWRRSAEFEELHVEVPSPGGTDCGWSEDFSF